MDDIEEIVAKALKNTSSDEQVGRQLVNARGAQETVVMPKRHWKYLDWLVERKLVNLEELVEQADIKRHQPKLWASLDTAIMIALAKDERKRKKAGAEFPGFIIPKISKRYVPKLIQGRPHEIKEDDLRGRRLINAFGVKETALMSQAHWEYYYWCSEQNCNMVTWAKGADELRPKDKSFGENLMYWLWDDLCARYREGVDVPEGPLPEGYET
ncbi:hypothetical protein [Parasulfitobacter algicola]|uniref:Uncharacterized protein n=1 Tax=Parasulfitobacter algicola TaxID=2614809 RepID=A0ABX2IWJ7_9RHOB|nr:hypothetical protein [Sulfitobacter algicola]NSX54804.1 hypothetical protein [Sulfitobacter algicola]